MKTLLRVCAGSLALVLGLTPMVAGESPDKPASIAGMSQTEVNDLVKQIIPAVEKLRGLEFKQPVPVRIVNDETTRRHMTSRIEKFLPRKKILRTQTAYLQLGLLPAGTEMLSVFLKILEEQVGGFYDPEENTFFVLDDMPRAIAPLLIAHELTHALDDQYFKLDELTTKSMENNDSSGAVGAVIEGSGTLIMTRYMLREMQAGRLSPEIIQEMAESEAGKAEVLKTAPALLQRGLMAPYVLGQTFLLKGNLARIMAGADPEEIDRVLENPPTSTEQVLHPEKYWEEAKRDEPREVVLPDLSASIGKGWKLDGGDVLGELEIAILVGAEAPDISSPLIVLPATWTNAAASGWAGDRWQLYRKGKRSISVLGTLWDSPEDAAEFIAALLPHLDRHAFLEGEAVVLVSGAGEQSGMIAKLLFKPILLATDRD
jgi:hypothetical protein